MIIANHGSSVMSIDNSDQPGPSPTPRSISMSQNIPGLCTGAVYRLFWTNQISMSTHDRRKRAPAPNDSCTIAFDLLDQNVNVMGGQNGAPLPYTNTSSADILRYRGNLPNNTFTITMNCSIPRTDYHIDNIAFLGPTGSCCSTNASSASYETTDYSLQILTTSS